VEFRPKLIICGGSAYCREWDYPRFRAIADKVGMAVHTRSRGVSHQSWTAADFPFGGKWHSLTTAINVYGQSTISRATAFTQLQAAVVVQ